MDYTDFWDWNTDQDDTELPPINTTDPDTE